jgi:YVTN family beta-propeller protein
MRTASTFFISILLATIPAAIGRAQSGPACTIPAPPATLDPVLKWSWTGSPVAPSSNQVIMPPLVANLTDDNGDGKIDANDIPDVVFVSTARLDGGLCGESAGILRAVSGKDGSVIFDVTDPAFGLNSCATPAIGDLDGDGVPEIVALQGTNQPIIFEHDGTVRRLTDTVPASSIYAVGAASIADLDHDGLPEIIIGGTVLDHDGHTIFSQPDAGNSGFGAISTTADLDLSGNLEVVLGFRAYRSDGTLFYQTPGHPEGGYPAIGNFDADPNPEVVVVASGAVYLLEHDGTIKWGPVAIPGGGRGGPPTVADFDGDGQPEIGVASYSTYTVFETDGTVKWSAPIRDYSSNITGSSVFDFNGDGIPEVVYNDETTLWIFRGTDGQVLFQYPSTSCTAVEYPTIADVDNDGHADLLAAFNEICGYGNAGAGVHVFSGRKNDWVRTRRIWNEHAYHVTNVDEDGRIPVDEQPNWLVPGLNNFRQNAPGPNEPSALAAPDLVITSVTADTTGCPDSLGLSARIENQGDADVAPGVNVAFYRGDPTAGGTLVGVAATLTRLQPGQGETVAVTAPGTFDATVFARADDDGTGVGRETECHEDNNVASAPAACASILRNGDFSQQLAFWTSVVETAVAGYPHFDVFPSTPCIPDAVDFFGLDVPFGSQGYIEQTVELPPSPSVLALTAWGSLDPTVATVSIVDQSDVEHVLETFTPPPTGALFPNGTCCQCLAVSPLHKTYPLSDFAGQSVTIRLRATAPGNNGTIANFDDVSITAVTVTTTTSTTSSSTIPRTSTTARSTTTTSTTTTTAPSTTTVTATSTTTITATTTITTPSTTTTTAPVPCQATSQCDDHDVCNGAETCQAGFCATPATATCTPAGAVAYVGSYRDDTVSVIDVGLRTTIATVSTGHKPWGIAWQPSGRHVYVTNRRSDSVTVIDAVSHAAVATIPVGHEPLGIAAAPQAERAYVANYADDTVTVIDTASGTALGTIPVGDGPTGVAVHPAGTWVYVTNYRDDTVSVVDPASQRTQTRIDVDQQPFQVAVHPNGDKVYVTNYVGDVVSVIGTASHTVVARIPVGHRPAGVAFTRDGARAIVVNSGSDTVSLIDVATDRVVATLPVGDGPLGAAAGVTDLWVTRTRANVVESLAEADGSVVGSASVGSEPVSLGQFIGTPPDDCPAQPLECDDHDPFTDDACDATTGCRHADLTGVAAAAAGAAELETLAEALGTPDHSARRLGVAISLLGRAVQDAETSSDPAARAAVARRLTRIIRLLERQGGGHTSRLLDVARAARRRLRG